MTDNYDELKEKYGHRHGGAFDRGMADSYYWRPRRPHKFAEGTYTSEEITDLDEKDLEAYEAGYDYNEKHGDKKDWM